MSMKIQLKKEAFETELNYEIMVSGQRYVGDICLVTSIK